MIFYLRSILGGPNGAVPRPVGGADIDGSGFREARPHRPALPVRCTDAATFGQVCGCSSAGERRSFGAGGHGFESCRLHHWLAQWESTRFRSLVSRVRILHQNRSFARPTAVHAVTVSKLSLQLMGPGIGLPKSGRRYLTDASGQRSVPASNPKPCRKAWQTMKAARRWRRVPGFSNPAAPCRRGKAPSRPARLPPCRRSPCLWVRGECPKRPGRKEIGVT